MKRFRVKLLSAWLLVFMILITSESVTTLAATSTIGSTVMKPSVNEPVILDDHTHSMASTVITSPTCTATGTRKYYCTKSGCNYSYTRSIAKTAHNYSTIVTTPPTCNSTGKTEKKCSCGATVLLGTIPKTNHSYYRSTLTSASCDTPGRVRVTCSKCGDYYFETIPKTGHSFSAATCTSPATCTKCGITSGSKLGHDYAPATCTSPSKCRVCGATTGSKANHRYSTWSIDRSASCTTTGTKHRVCRDCGDVDVATISATGHDYASATCTSPKTCRTCGYQDGTAPGHQWGDWITDEVVSCIYDGAQHRECRICRSIETKRIISPGHDFSPATCTSPATCRRCGATTGTQAEHNWDSGTVISHISCMSDEIVRKKCTNPGCTAYRDTVTRKHTPEKHDHDYTSYHFVRTVPATCKSRGYDLYHCDACGENFEENYTDYSSHSWGDWIVDEVMTCGYDGAQHRECRVCKTTETERIPAPGHNMGSWQVTQSVNCKQDGIETRSCRNSNCGYKETRVYATKTNDHSWGAWVVEEAATCAYEGAEHRSCAVCGRMEQAKIDKVEHSFREATCTEPQTCRNCGVTKGTAHGHNWGDWVIEEEANCAYEGVKHRVCARCQEMEQAKISKPDHVFAAATCTEPQTCVNCGATNGEKLGHDWKEATCTEPKKCNRCGATEGEAIGHSHLYIEVDKNGVPNKYVCETCGKGSLCYENLFEHNLGRTESEISYFDALKNKSGNTIYHKIYCDTCKTYHLQKHEWVYLEGNELACAKCNKYEAFNGTWEVLREANYSHGGNGRVTTVQGEVIDFNIPQLMLNMNYVEDYIAISLMNKGSSIYLNSRENYANNSEKWQNRKTSDYYSNGYIIDQGKLNDYKLGLYTADSNSCELIATYNALVYLEGEDNTFSYPDIIKEFETNPNLGIVLLGWLGTSPMKVYDFLARLHKYEVDFTIPMAPSKAFYDRYQGKYDAFIISYGNCALDPTEEQYREIVMRSAQGLDFETQSKDIVKKVIDELGQIDYANGGLDLDGFHTVCITKDNGVFTMYNDDYGEIKYKDSLFNCIVENRAPMSIIGIKKR